MLPLIPNNKDLSKTKPELQIVQISGLLSGNPVSQRQVNLAQRVIGFSNGFKNPDWRNKVQRKEDATTALLLRVDDIKYVNVSSTYRYRFFRASDKTDFQGVVTACPPADFSSFPSVMSTSWDCYAQARNIALAYKRKYVDDMTRPFQSQVFLGEIKETLDFIRHPFGKLRALANSANVARYNAAIKHYKQAAVRHRGGVFERTNEARLLLNDVADAWFEIRFAMLPLVSDISAAFNVINGRKAQRRSSFRGDAKQTINPSTSIFPFGNLSGYQDITGYIQCKYYINTGIIFNDNTNMTGFAEYLSKSTQTLVDWIPTVYELTPGSWLLDYFVNVGDLLNSVAASSKVSLSYSSHTAVCDYVKQSRFRPVGGDAFVQVLSVGSQAYTEYSRRFVQRTVDTDNFPSVTFRLPTGMSELANTAFYLSRKFANVFGH